MHLARLAIIPGRPRMIITVPPLLHPKSWVWPGDEARKYICFIRISDFICAIIMGYNNMRVLIRILNFVLFSNFSEIATTLSLVLICS